MKKLIAGNWKMNGTLEDSKSLIRDLINGIHSHSKTRKSCDFVVCPPTLYLAHARHSLLTTGYFELGAQDCSAFDNGAHTGEISAAMLKDSKCEYVILGHSERRHGLGESDEDVAAKAVKAHAAGLITIICVGETDEERQSGKAQDVVAAQLSASLPPCSTAENTVIAYEPVWAIGTGNTATPDDVKDMHGFIRQKLQEQLEKAENLRILYGGSMKPENAGALLATENVDGGLIGGASLNAEDFLAIALNA